MLFFAEIMLKNMLFARHCAKLFKILHNYALHQKYTLARTSACFAETHIQDYAFPVGLCFSIFDYAKKYASIIVSMPMRLALLTDTRCM